MTPEELQEARSELDSRVAEARQTEDPALLADALTRRASVSAVLEIWGDADRDLAEACDCWLQADDVGSRARSTYVRGGILARMPDRQEDAEALYRQAAAMGRVAGDRETEMKALESVAAVLGGRGDLEGAMAQHQLIADMCREAGDQAGLADALRNIAAMWQARGRPNQALKVFERALAASRKSADPGRILRGRMDKRAQQAFASHPGTMESLEDLAAEAKEQGSFDLSGQAELQRGAELMRQGNADDAALAGETARALALETHQPVVYVMACLLISETCEAKGDRPGVLAILLTCKQTMEQSFGKEAGRPVVQVLDSLEERWGAEGLQTALVEYRRRIARRMPQA
ncbi:MAG: tetratricopeptide repeat protein [Proteobacteria bacterium]|nr:tetratricopeptide repeat protein [Pseudomonadota bacterium]MCP4918335.1 tetratricopeptide repeat protein [Pseudomonadota bacterium]